MRLKTRKKKMENERARRVELEGRITDTSNLNTPFELDTQKRREGKSKTL